MARAFSRFVVFPAVILPASSSTGPSVGTTAAGASSFRNSSREYESSFSGRLRVTSSFRTTRNAYVIVRFPGTFFHSAKRIGLPKSPSRYTPWCVKFPSTRISVISWFPSDSGYGIHSRTVSAAGGEARFTLTVTRAVRSLAQALRGTGRRRKATDSRIAETRSPVLPTGRETLPVKGFIEGNPPAGRFRHMRRYTTAPHPPTGERSDASPRSADEVHGVRQEDHPLSIAIILPNKTGAGPARHRFPPLSDATSSRLIRIDPDPVNHSADLHRRDDRRRTIPRAEDACIGGETPRLQGHAVLPVARIRGPDTSLVPRFSPQVLLRHLPFRLSLARERGTRHRDHRRRHKSRNPDRVRFHRLPPCPRLFPKLPSFVPVGKRRCIRDAEPSGDVTFRKNK